MLFREIGGVLSVFLCWTSGLRKSRWFNKLPGSLFLIRRERAARERDGARKGVFRYNRTAITIECVTLRVIVVPCGLLRRIKAAVFTIAHKLIASVL